jgi:hypothetical protein
MVHPHLRPTERKAAYRREMPENRQHHRKIVIVEKTPAKQFHYFIAGSTSFNRYVFCLL